MGKVYDALGREEKPDTYAIDKAGNAVALQQHQTQGALDTGYTPVTEQYAKDMAGAQRDLDYADEHYGTVGKGFLGAADMLSLGTIPAALVGSGAMTEGHLDAARTSGAYTAGQVAGALAPAFLSGGTSLAAEGAAEAGGGIIARALAGAARSTPLGLAMRAGEVSEGLVGRMLPEVGLMGKVGSSAAKMAARGATEGALISMVQNSSDAVIHNKPLTAAAILSAGEEGALFGGVTGGIMGGAGAAVGAGVDLVGGRAASAAGGGAEKAAARALKELGADEGFLARAGATEGGLTSELKGFYKVLQENQMDLRSATPDIHRAAKATATKWNAVADDALEQLETRSPAALDGRLSQWQERIKQDLFAKNPDGISNFAAQKFMARLEKQTADLLGTAEEAPAYAVPKPSPTKFVADRAGYEKAVSQWEAGKVAHEAAFAGETTGAANWKALGRLRDDLAGQAKAATGINKEFAKTALNAFDDELKGAMTRANPELAEVYAGAKMSARFSEELSDLTAKKVAQSLSKANPLKMNGADAATLGYSVLAGANPLVGAGIIAGKKLVAHAQEVMSPVVAEAAARSALGVRAAHATMQLGQNISKAMNTFLSGAKTGATAEFTKPKSKAYSMDAYRENLAVADELTSAAHQQKVRETTDALATAGHEELAKEMAMTYGRAVAMVNAARPKGRMGGAHEGMLTKPARIQSPNSAAMKFINRISAIRDPQGAILGGLEDGSVSRDEVAAVKYVMPAFHQELVQRASDAILAKRQAGEFLDPEKLSLLACVLQAPVDTTQSKEFIAEIQKAHSANAAPPPDAGQAPAPTTNISAYQTPNQRTMA